MVFGANGFVGSLMFTTQRITIGRDPAAMVRLDDPTVSLRHALLSFDANGIQLKDLGSRTGSRINGAAASDSPIQATDEIGIGVFKLRLSIHRADAGFAARRNAADVAVPTPMGQMKVAGHEAEPAPPTVPPERPEVRRVVVRREPMPSEATLVKEPRVRPRIAGVESAPPAEAKTSGRPGALRRPAPKVIQRQAPRTAREPSPEAEPNPIDELLGSTLAEQGASPNGRPATPPGFDAPKIERTLGFDEIEPARAQILDPEGGAAGRRLRSFDDQSEERTDTRQNPAPREGKRAPPEPMKPAPASPLGGPQPRREAGADSPAPGEILPVVVSRPHDHDDEDDEDDDTDFEPPFDLLELLSRASLAAKDTLEPTTVEVVQFRDDRVISVHHVAPGESFRLPGSDVDCGARAADGSFTLFTAVCGAIHLRQNDRPLNDDEARPLVQDPRLRLVAGMQATVDIGEGEEKILFQLVPRAAAVELPKLTFKPSVDRLVPTASSMAVHLGVFMFIAVAVLGGKKEDAAESNEGRFATITVKEPDMEPPPPKPPEPEPTPPEDAPTMPVHDRQTVHERNAPVARQPQQTSQERQSAASTAKILSALGGSSTPVSSITNLDAISVPQGTSGFKVSGVVGKSPGDSLRIAATSDGNVDTKSAAELGNVGKIHARSGPDVVRARVTGAPPAMQGEGHLSRGEIQRVINAHIYQVQGCYERQLMKDPTISGKISFQWVISPSGAVNGVRVGQSSLHSGEVAGCIQQAIQGWIFPQPQGGSVTITYPFSFVGN
jgi:predicted component of type VI protein secretion system